MKNDHKICVAGQHLAFDIQEIKVRGQKAKKVVRTVAPGGPILNEPWRLAEIVVASLLRLYNMQLHRRQLLSRWIPEQVEPILKEGKKKSTKQ